MRPRTIISIAIICFGAALLTLAVSSFFIHYSFSLNWTITGGIGAVILIVGALILTTELIEVWLTRGQTALVDGLQAG